MSDDIEKSCELRLDFDKLAKVASCGRAILPCVVQNADDGRVLIVAYVDKVALERSLKDRVAVFWSTSRNELWVKGATSGDYLDLVEVRVNCEQNSLLYLVRPRNGGVCHTKGADGRHRQSCYYRRIEGDGLSFVEGQE